MRAKLYLGFIKRKDPPMSLAADLPLDHAPRHDSAAGRGAEMVLWLVPVVLLLLTLAVQTWGPVALTMAALPLVPAMFVIFVWITLP